VIAAGAKFVPVGRSVRSSPPEKQEKMVVSW